MVLAVCGEDGYEPDMIEMDMALETELGVDSIKRVEILSDVQKELDGGADVAALARHPDGRRGRRGHDRRAAQRGRRRRRPRHQAAQNGGGGGGGGSGVSAEEATRVVLAVFVAKTGYEPDMIEMAWLLRRSWAF